MAQVKRNTAARGAAMKAIFQTIVGTDAKGDEPTIVISTAAVDRQRDVLEPLGARLENFRRNPVVLFGHDHFALPVGKATEIAMEDDGLRMRWQWLENDTQAARVRNAWEQGVLRAASVGFLPITEEPLGTGGYRFTEWELLEVSLVPVPANPEAVRTLKALGLPVRSAAADDALSRVTFTLTTAARELRTFRRQKAGRVLSAANETKIRRAVSAIEDATELLDAVLTQLDDLEDDDVKQVLVLDDDEDIPDDLIRDVVEATLRDVIREQLMQRTGVVGD